MLNTRVFLLFVGVSAYFLMPIHLYADVAGKNFSSRNTARYNGGVSSISASEQKEKQKKFQIIATPEEVASFRRKIREKHCFPQSSNIFPNESRDIYDSLIQEAADQYGLDFYLIKAVIQVESGFNPKAVSPKGAMGLMQIMPQNVRNWRMRDPFNPRESIFYGSFYLKELLNDFPLQLALAAYNAGPEAVRRARGVPNYSETQNYVRKVLGLYKALKAQ